MLLEVLLPGETHWQVLYPWVPPGGKYILPTGAMYLPAESRLRAVRQDTAQVVADYGRIGRGRQSYVVTDKQCSGPGQVVCINPVDPNEIIMPGEWPGHPKSPNQQCDDQRQQPPKGWRTAGIVILYVLAAILGLLILFVVIRFIVKRVQAARTGGTVRDWLEGIVPITVESS